MPKYLWTINKFDCITFAEFVAKIRQYHHEGASYNTAPGYWVNIKDNNYLDTIHLLPKFETELAGNNFVLSNYLTHMLGTNRIAAPSSLKLTTRQLIEGLGNKITSLYAISKPKELCQALFVIDCRDLLICWIGCE